MTKNEFFTHIGTINRYALLDRMRADCEYVINAAGCNKDAYKYLWARTPEEQITYMRYLLESFPEDEKPAWIKETDIDYYALKLRV